MTIITLFPTQSKPFLGKIRFYSYDNFSSLLFERLSDFKKRAIIHYMVHIGEPVSEERALQLNPVVLAFVGDAVYTLCVRERLALSTGRKTGELNRLTSERVSAHGQSELLERVLPLLTEQEDGVYRRGRNAKKLSRSKHATSAEYSRSTGFEALIGYLYLTGRHSRIEELFFNDAETKEEHI